MGVDKRTVELDGETLLERAVRRLASASWPVTVVGGPSDVPSPATHVADDEPGAGPMGGLRTALVSVPAPVAAVAVDMPDVSTTLLAALAGLAEPIAAVPVVDGVLQPLHAVWGPDAASALNAAWDDGERSLRRFLGGPDVRRVAPRQWRKMTSDEGWWVSLDTVADLEARQSR